ncbi:MAG: NUDIX domain-containing protein [Rikenellaceae bacterium]
MTHRVYFGDYLLVIGGVIGDGVAIGREDLTIDRVVAMFNLSPTLYIEENCFGDFASQFKLVDAAGGVVKRDGQALLIFRNGRWDLPKGHWEQGETMEQCAIREVEEETGVESITIEHHLVTTLHFYNMRGVWELKSTHWYAMSSDCHSDLTPQNEEGIEIAEWVELPLLRQRVEGSFPTVRCVIDEFMTLA